MTREYMLDVLGDIEDRYIVAASRGRRVRKRTGRKLLVLVAALVALLALGLVSYAKNWFGLRSFLFSVDRESEQTTEVGETEFGEAPNTDNGNVMSLQGYMDSPESLAMKEWLSFLAGYDEDKSIIYAIGNQLTGLEEEYGCYYVYTQEMADKLEEILTKYGLRKHTRCEVLSYEQLVEAVGGVFFDEARHSHNTGYIYEDGTFHMDGDWASPDGNVSYQLSREVNGTLTDIYLPLAGNVDSYDQWPYRSGKYDMVLALAENRALLIADLGDAFATLHILDGTTGRWMPEDAVMTKELMEQLADSFCLDVLATVRVPDLDAILDVPPAGTTVWEREDILDGYKGYANVLWQIYRTYENPDMIYSIWDVDGDGECELLIQEGTCEADFVWHVYAHGQSLKTICSIGEVPGGHSRLYAAEGGGIWIVQGQMGVEWLYKVTMENGELHSETVVDGLWVQEYSVPSDLEIPCTNITDVSPLVAPYKGPVEAHDHVLPDILSHILIHGDCGGNLGVGWLFYTVSEREDQDYKIYFFADQSTAGGEGYQSVEEIDFNFEQADFVFPDVRDNNTAIGKFVEMYLFEPFTTASGESAIIVIATYETEGKQYYDTRIYTPDESGYGYVLDEAMTEELNALYADVEEYPVSQIIEMPHD